MKTTLRIIFFFPKKGFEKQTGGAKWSVRRGREKQAGGAPEAAGRRLDAAL